MLSPALVDKGDTFATAAAAGRFYAGQGAILL